MGSGAAAISRALHRDRQSHRMGCRLKVRRAHLHRNGPGVERSFRDPASRRGGPPLPGLAPGALGALRRLQFQARYGYRPWALVETFVGPDPPRWGQPCAPRTSRFSRRRRSRPHRGRTPAAETSVEGELVRMSCAGIGGTTVGREPPCTPARSGHRSSQDEGPGGIEGGLLPGVGRGCRCPRLRRLSFARHPQSAAPSEAQEPGSGVHRQLRGSDRRRSRDTTG